ncbi:unnamed protein product (macronuclear) [Paramecium tetraurelia]|uniref:Uncharacterized protein n=1 Tax=Paramecium tetraurelia TaxID=5888 RepID=A0DKW4_PARTE|nr:uncharacterized protein GSPATT00017998001 [Paramecium tetraurelia]CAK83681.1 unnamed protein product [Paramecium tetraurelia]|eukprot:XP_001451078.1 hypothetical protein (macronuclear) [Paramecium tetraurelia strain d4-2]
MKSFESSIKQHIPQQIIRAAEKFESLFVKETQHHQSQILYFKIMAKDNKRIKEQLQQEPKIGLSELGHLQQTLRKSGTFGNENSQSIIHCMQILKPEFERQVYIDELTTVISEQIPYDNSDFIHDCCDINL